jgi:hypothetical protein
MVSKKVLELAKEAGIPFNHDGLVGCIFCEEDIDDALDYFSELVVDSELNPLRKVSERALDQLMLFKAVVPDLWTDANQEALEALRDALHIPLGED